MIKKIAKKCKKKGCKAYPIKGSVYCFAHDPKRQAERKAEQAQGGRTSMAPKTLANADYKLKTISEVKIMLRDITNASLRGDIDLNRAKTAGYLASLIITCLRDYDLEKRMEKIEEILKNKGEN